MRLYCKFVLTSIPYHNTRSHVVYEYDIYNCIVDY